MKIDLIVRGICCLRPQLKGMSDNITVRSIVDRFLEHSRVFYFENACQPEIFVGSADWMPRNFYRRIEVIFPIEDGNLRERVTSELLALAIAGQCESPRHEVRTARITASGSSAAKRRIAARWNSSRAPCRKTPRAADAPSPNTPKSNSPRARKPKGGSGGRVSPR